jgi:hypothetical protein
MYNHPWGVGVFYGLIWLVIVGTGLTALWRAMRAHETIAKQLESIARSLQTREPPK